MEDIINIATFQFDSDRLQSSLNSLQDSMFKLKKEQEGYNQTSRDAQKEINQTLKVQALLINAGQQEGDEYKKNAQRLKELNDVQREAYKAQQQTATEMSRVRQEITATNTQLRAYMDSEAKQTTLQDAANKALQTQITNINTARASNTELLRVRNQLNPAIAAEAKLIQDLNAQLDSNNEFIKNNASAYEQQKINIGNYTQSIKDAIGESGLFGGKMQQVTQVFNTFAPVFNTINADIKNTINQLNIFGNSAQNAGQQTQGAAQSTGLLGAAQRGLAAGFNVATAAARIFAIALAATGIGLIIGAVVLLVSYLKTFTPVVDKVEQGMAAFGAVVKVVQQGIMAFIEGLSDLEGTLAKIGTFLSNPIKGFKEMGSAMAEAASEAATLMKAQQDLEDALEMQEIQTARNRAEINRLNIQARDRTKSDAERIALLKQAAELEDADFQARSKNSAEKLRIAQQDIKNQANLTAAEFEELKKRGFAYKEFVETRTNDTDALFDALKEAQLSQTEIDNEYYQNQEKNINRQNKLIEDREAAAKKAADEAEKRREKERQEAQKRIDDGIKAMQTELDFYLESQGERKRDMAEQLEIDREVMRQSLAIKKAEYDAKKITQREFELASLEITNEFAAQQVDATIANAEIELELFKMNHQRKLDENQFFSDQLYQQELERINKLAEAEAAQQTLLFQQGKINAQEYGLAIAQIDQAQAESNAQADKDRQQAIKDQQAADLAIQDELNAERFDYDLGLQLERFDRQYAEEKAKAEAAGADMLEFEKLQAQKRKDIEASVLDNKLSLASQTLGNLGTIMGKESAAGKALAVAQAVMDTYRGATSAYASLAPIPIVGPALGGIAAGAAVAAGLANVKKITSTKEAKPPKPGYARGVIGLTGAGTGTSDSISANLSAGESVLTAEATRRFPNLLSAVNQIGGGVGLNGMTASENSLLQNDITNGANNSQMVSAIAEAVALGSELGTRKGSQDGIRDLSSERQIMADAKF